MSAAKQKPTPSPEESALPKHLVQLSIPTPAGDAAQEAMTAVAYAKAFSVVTASDSAKGQEARARLNTRIKVLTEARLSLTRPIDAAKKVIMDFFAGPILQFTEARDAIDEKVLAYDREQDRVRQAEQRRLDKIAEDERKRLQDIADEAKRKADAEAAAKRKAADEAAAAGRRAEAERLRAQAERVEERADAKAEVFETRAAAIVAPIAQSDTARVAGSSFRDHWEFEVIDATQINPQFMMPDEVKIGRIVTSLKADAVGVVGNGIKVTSRRILASRRT